jgi:amino acid permease
MTDHETYLINDDTIQTNNIDISLDNKMNDIIGNTERERKNLKPKPDVKTLSFFTTVLAYISTIIGGGIVGLPYSFYYAGIPLAVILNIIIGFTTLFSIYLFLRAKDLTGGHE